MAGPDGRPEQPAVAVHHHVALRRRGGAAGVARMLAGLQKEERPVSLSYELDEPGQGSGTREFACEPSLLASLAPSGSLVHVHATRDWAALLEGFIAAPRPLAVTAHDSSLITGGCVFPVFCALHAKGCPDPCPREFPGSFANRARKRELVEMARPVLVSPSSWLARQLKREWPGLTVKVVPNAVVIPLALPDKASARSRLGVSPAARVALFMAHGGVKAAYKGGDRFEAIIGKLSGLVPGLVGIVAGGDALGKAPGVLHYPYAEGGLLADLLGASDVLVYPSLADNHPLVILEAMAAGLPVASYSVGGVPEQVAEGETGLLAPVRDEDALVRAAARILTDHALARLLGEGARERAARHFGAARMASDYARVYARLPRTDP